MPVLGSAAQMTEAETVNTVLSRSILLKGSYMPALKQAVPRYRKHIASGQAIVTVQGQYFYLGPWNCSENPALLRKWGYKTSPSQALAGCFVMERQWWRRYLRRRLLGFRAG